MSSCSFEVHVLSQNVNTASAVRMTLSLLVTRLAASNQTVSCRLAQCWLT